MRRIVFACVFALSALPAAAETIDWVCNVDVHKSGWVGGTYRVSIDTDARSGQVTDRLGQRINGGPSDAELADFTDKKQVVTWQLRTKDSKGQLAVMDYRLSIFTPKNNVTIRARPLGYANDFSKRGRCKVAQ